jgi:phosphoribosyl-AMP cyclohydrolase
MPVSLSNGQISATTTGTKKATYSAKKGTTEVSVTRAADADGVFSFSQAQSIPAGTYDFFRLQGTPLPATSMVVSTIQILGEKAGPDASRISFAVNGIDNGRVLAIVYVDGSQALYQTVTVGNGSSWTRQQPPRQQPPVHPTRERSKLTPSPAGSSKHFFSRSKRPAHGNRQTMARIKAPRSPTDYCQHAYAIAPTPHLLTSATIISSLLAHTNTTAFAHFIGRARNSAWSKSPALMEH